MPSSTAAPLLSISTSEMPDLATSVVLRSQSSLPTTTCPYFLKPILRGTVPLGLA